MGWVSPLAVWNAANTADVMVRLGMTKRSPSTKSSNQRCCGTMRCAAGSNSAMAGSCEVCQRLLAYRYRRGFGAAIHTAQFVMPGLVPGIHVFKTARTMGVDGRNKSGHDESRNVAVRNELARQNLHRLRRALGAPCRHWPDAGVCRRVRVWRYARQIHRRDLFGRAIIVAARRRGANRAVAIDLAAPPGILAPGAAAAAVVSRGAVDARGRGVLPRNGVSAARRRRHLLPGVSDLRHR